MIHTPFMILHEVGMIFHLEEEAEQVQEIKKKKIKIVIKIK